MMFSYGLYYIYFYEIKEFIELKGDYIYMFDNGDVFWVVYDMLVNKVVYMWMNFFIRKIIWNRILMIEKEIEGLLVFIIFDVIKSKDRKSIWIYIGVILFI